MEFDRLLYQYKEKYNDDRMFRIRRRKQEISVSGNMFYEGCKRLAAFLAEHTEEGSHIGLLSSDGLDMAFFLFGVIASGRVAVPLNKDLNETELSECIKAADVSYILYNEEEESVIEILRTGGNIEEYLLENILEAEDNWGKADSYQFPDTEERSLSLLLFSSGTTGKGKIVMLSQETLTANLLTTDLLCQRRRVYFPYPCHHIAFVALLLIHLGQGDEVCLQSSMKYFLQDVFYFKPQQIDVVPSLFVSLSEKAKRSQEFYQMLQKNLQRIWSVGATLTYSGDNVINCLGVEIISSYGATETGGVVVDYVKHSPDSVGPIAEFNQVRINERGEVLVKGKNLMMGYYHDPEQTAAVIVDGWFHTGDMGEIGENQELYIKGRLKNTIIMSNGENVNPEEIEAELCRCIWVDEAYVYGDDEKIYAAVVNHQYLREKDFGKRKKILEKIEEERKSYNRAVPTYRQVRQIKVREKEFVQTSSGKIKRGKENEE